MELAVLLTCHNRKDKTVKCLRHLYDAFEKVKGQYKITVFLTDDGSADGTSNAIRDNFPMVNIIQGDGSLYWAGGMRKSWNEALKTGGFDGFLLLNDDTYINNQCFNELSKTHQYSIKNYGKPGIYVGSVKDPITNDFTYGGKKVVNKWSFATSKVIPSGQILECQLGNANVMFVHRNVVETIGIFSIKYTHGKADHDYTLRAIEKNFPVLVCSDYCGLASNDHTTADLRRMILKERIQYLLSPKGIELSGYMYFMWRFFPWRAPFVFCSQWLKVLFPFLIGK